MAIRIPMVGQQLLAEQGLVPANCSRLELVIPVAGPMVLRYEVFVAAEHLEKLSLLFQVLASEAKEVQDKA
jgi:hypothetical protein